MGKSYRVMREAFIQAVARGGTLAEAWAGAGYRPRPDMIYRARLLVRAMTPRLDAIRREREAAARDLVPLIETMTQMARDAAGTGGAAGWSAARGLLAEAGRLKLRMPPLIEPAEVMPEMSEEEWLAEFAPKAVQP